MTTVYERDTAEFGQDSTLCSCSSIPPSGVKVRAPTVDEVIEDPRRIHAIARSFASVGNEGVLLDRGGEGRLRLTGIDRLRLSWAFATPEAGWGPPPHVVEMIGYNSVYRLFLSDVTDF